MIVKVLQNKEGKYLKDFCLETIDHLFRPVTGLMCYWVTDDPNEAMHFYSSNSAIVARSWVGRHRFDYKNVEINNPTEDYDSIK
jgi:hypothetical protein|nr:MAG TPA: hypothetical protein [Caudoviricetes sp.]